MQTTRSLVLLIVGVAILVMPAAHAGDTTFNLSTGVEFVTGEYGGNESIDELYVPIRASLDGDRFGFRLTVPYLEVTGPAGTTTADGEIVAGSGATVTESGLGDVTASLTLYDLINDPENGFLLDVTASVKLGTADEAAGLGTGENDYSVRFDAYRYFERVVLIGSAGYKLRGSPAGVDLENVFTGTIGAAYDVSSTSLLGVYYDFRQSAIVGADNIRELTVFASTDISESWDVQFYAFAGFTDSSADWGGGIVVSTNFRSFAVREPL